MTDGTIQAARRTARQNLTEALELLKGEPGLKLKEQRDRLESATDLAADAVEALEAAQGVVADRRAAKKAAKSA